MRRILSNIISKHVLAEFEDNYQRDGGDSDWNYYWNVLQPGETLDHYSDKDKLDYPVEPIDKVVNRDDYPSETGGQGEVDTVDWWMEDGNGLYVIEPAFENGQHDLPKENFQYFQDYLDNERAG